MNHPFDEFSKSLSEESTDIWYDNNNCGACGAACAPGEYCFEGYCYLY